MLGAQASPYRQSGDLQVSCGFRYFKSFRQFVGDDEEAARENDVVNTVGLADVELAYAFGMRWSFAASLPYQIAERSEAIRNSADMIIARSRSSARGIGDATLAVRAWVLPPRRFVRGNLLLGAGLKLPTGSPNVTDAFVDEVRTVDPSIQPGDGGIGFAASAQGFFTIDPVVLYFAGTYLINPRATNNVPTYRGRPSEAYMSVTDQYLARIGAFTRIPIDRVALSGGLGLRLEGTPVEDLLGSSAGFRRPGYSLGLEPALAYSRGAWSFAASVPIALYRKRTQSVPEKEDGRRGDATLADYAILVGFTYTRAASRPRPPPVASTPVIDATVTTLEGQPASLRAMRGAKLTVVNLWAAWCKPCRNELPMLARMRPDIEARGGALIGVAIDEDRAESKRLLAELGVALPSVHGGPAFAEAIGADIAPTTLILDANGTVVLRLAGEIDEATLRAAIDRTANASDRIVPPPG